MNLIGPAHFVLEVPGSKLRVLIAQRIVQLRAEIQRIEAEAHIYAEEVRQRVARLAAQIPVLHTDQAQIPKQSTEPVKQMIAALSLINSLIDPHHTYALTLTDLERLDLVQLELAARQ